MKLRDFLEKKIFMYDNQVIQDECCKITYGEFWNDAKMFSEKLRGERCCVIVCHSELNTAKALVSCFIAGVTAVPLSLRYGEKHCQKIIGFIEPTAIITDSDHRLEICRLSGNYVQPNEPPMLIMCTSGTTGTPKGVMLSESNIFANVKDIDLYFELNNQDVILISRPLYHCAVLTGEFLVSLINGVKIVFLSQAFNPKVLLKELEKEKITVLCGTPTLFSLLIKSSTRPVDSFLKKICVSGECMDFQTGRMLHQFFRNADIYHVYGLTEACPRVSWLPPNLFEQYPDSVGYPLPSVSLKVLDSSGEELLPNVPGMLWIKGDNVTKGYYKSPKQTNKVLNDGWLCTGDIAVIDENGLLYIQGRFDDMIIRGGMNIYPQEIEAVLKQDFRVADVMVYGYKSPIMGVQIGLQIVGDFNNINEVKRLCSKTLPEFQIPTKIEIVHEIQINGSGKKVRKL